jgi:ABC-type branched-subunit amino acid transport system ATPase component
MLSPRSRSQPTLTIRDAAFGYRDLIILKQVNLSVHGGEVIGLWGANGSGKTTLLRGLIGYAYLAAGTVELSGVSIRGGTPEEILSKHKIAYLPQEARGIPNLTVTENLELAMWRCGGRRQRRQAVLRLLETEEFARLASYLSSRVSSLSGGQRLLVSLAMMAATEADLYLFDEPSGGADEQARQAGVRVMKRLANAGACVLLVEQIREVLFGVSGRVFEIVRADAQSDATARANTLREVLPDRLAEVRHALAMEETRAAQAERSHRC